MDVNIPEWAEDEKTKNEVYAIQYLRLAEYNLEKSNHYKYAEQIAGLREKIQNATRFDLFKK